MRLSAHFKRRDFKMILGKICTKLPIRETWVYAWCPMRIRRAFSLVEILVVIAVIGVLMVLVLSALSGVKESSGETACANNLKHLGAATIAYLAANDDYLPQV